MSLSPMDTEKESKGLKSAESCQSLADLMEPSILSKTPLTSDRIRVIVRVRPESDALPVVEHNSSGLGKLKAVSSWNLRESFSSPAGKSTLDLNGKSFSKSKALSKLNVNTAFGSRTPNSAESSAKQLKSMGSFSSVSSSSPSQNGGPISPTKACCIKVLNNNMVKILKPPGITREQDKTFIVDRVYSDDCTQEDIYESVADFVSDAVKGHSTTVFAFGAAKSGKSYTMMGTRQEYGIIPRAIEDVFSLTEYSKRNEPDSYYYIEVSFIELYNNNFRNLLKNAPKELMAFQDSDEKATVVEDVDDLDAMFLPDSPTEKATNSGSPDGHLKRSNSKVIKTTIAAQEKLEKIDIHESKTLGVFVTGELNACCFSALFC